MNQDMDSHGHIMRAFEDENGSIIQVCRSCRRTRLEAGAMVCSGNPFSRNGMVRGSQTVDPHAKSDAELRYYRRPVTS